MKRTVEQVVWDAEALDWLQENGRGLAYDDETGMWKLDNGEGPDGWPWEDSPRKAIAHGMVASAHAKKPTAGDSAMRGK